MRKTTKKNKLITAAVTVVVLSSLFAIHAFASTYLDYTGPHTNYYGKGISSSGYSTVISTPTYSVDYNFGVIVALKTKINGYDYMGTPRIKVQNSNMISTEYHDYSDSDMFYETVYFYPSIVNGYDTYTVKGHAYVNDNSWALCKITGQARYF